MRAGSPEQQVVLFRVVELKETGVGGLERWEEIVVVAVAVIARSSLP